MSEKERRDYRSLGEILADARSERKMTVAQVSERTKIAPRMITSLENDELENLSGPVYARGFLRSLCKLYDLDHTWMMSKLEAGLETTSPTPVVNVPPVPTPTGPAVPPTGDSSGSKDGDGPSEHTWKIEKVDSARVRRIRTQPRRGVPRKVWAILIVILVLAAIVLFGRSLFGGESGAWIGHSASGSLAAVREHFPRASPQVSTSTATAPAESSLAEPSRAGAATEGQPPDPEPAEKPEEVAAQETSPPSDASAEASDEPRPSARVVDSAGTEEEGVERVHYRDVESYGLTSVVRLDDQDLSTPMLLEIRARDQVEVEVKIDDDSGGQRRVLSPGQVMTVRAFQKFSLDISDYEAVVVELDGIRREPPHQLEMSWVLHRDTPASE